MSSDNHFPGSNVNIYPCNLPYNSDDNNFEPLTEPHKIKEWNEWLEYTAKNIGVTVDDILSNNFKTLKDLLKWCSSDERYHFAFNIYVNQCSTYISEVLKYFEENNEEEYNKFTQACVFIEDAFDYVLYGLFKQDFIWGCDTKSIMTNKSAFDIAIFDNSSVKNILHNFVINHGPILDEYSENDI